jgi:hypothetical protein
MSTSLPRTLVKSGYFEDIHMNVQECYCSLRDWNLEPVRKYLMAKEGVAEAEAREMEDEYRKFIALLSEGTGGDPPSKYIDPFRHAHILHSRDYTSMCLSTFGRYIHHEPGEASVELKGKYGEMLERYRTYFGEPGRLWKNKGDCSQCCDCGECKVWGPN